MSSRVPTDKQYRILLNLGSSAAMITANRRTVEPLLRRDWVTATEREGYYAWIRITPTGLRALADAVERYGLPEIGPRPQTERRVCARCGSEQYRFEVVDVMEVQA